MEQELKLLLARAEDAVRLCELRNIPKFLGFLSPGEATAISACIRNPNVYYFGGYDDAERRAFGVIPDYVTEPFSAFPINVLKIIHRPVDKLTHRDVLGSLMAAGITRDCVGDIRISDGLIFVFVLEDVAEYLAQQITKIGRVGVKVQVVSVNDAVVKFPAPMIEKITFTVSSPRLDAIISALAGCSRSKAEQLICDGLVFINSFEITKAIKQVKAGDKISVRGIGKFIITGTGNFSKKGREIITADKYI